MSLHFEMKVNDQKIGTVYIQRLHELIPGQPSKYRVEVDYLGELNVAEILHNYEDGALVLISKALSQISEGKGRRIYVSEIVEHIL